MDDCEHDWIYSTRGMCYICKHCGITKPETELHEPLNPASEQQHEVDDEIDTIEARINAMEDAASVVLGESIRRSMIRVILDMDREELNEFELVHRNWLKERWSRGDKSGYVKMLKRRDGLIAAIRWVRNASGMGLADSKDYVESLK